MTTQSSPPAAKPDFEFLNGAAPTGPVKRRRPGKVVWGAAAIFLILTIFWWRKRSASTPHPEVKTATVERTDVKAIVSATGKLQAFSTVDVKSRASGTVLQLTVEEGSRVKKGQLIAVIDRQDTSAAYKQAAADLASAQANFAQAQLNAQKTSADFGPQLKQSQAGVASARAKLQQAQQNFEQETVTNPAAIAQARDTVVAARAKLDQSKAALTIERRTREADLATAQEGVKSAQVKLRQAQQQSDVQPSLSTAAVESAQGAVASAQASFQNAQQALNQLQNATQPQEKAQVQADVDAAKSNVLVAQQNLDRQKALYEGGAVARSTVESAQNQLDAARTTLQANQAKLDTLSTGQDAALNQARATVESARSSLEQARANLNTAKGNQVQDQIKRGDVDAAKAALNQSNATLKTAQANLRQVTVKQRDVDSSMASLRQGEAALRTAIASGRQVDVQKAAVQDALAALQQSEATLASTQNNRLTVAAGAQSVADARAKLERAKVTAENARQNLDQTEVTAPRDGVVLQKYVDVGAIIQSGQSGFTGGTSIVQLGQLDRVYVNALVDEADIGQVKPGQKVDITLDAYPDAPKTGTVRKIYPLAQEEENVTYIQVQVEVDRKFVDSTLRPQMNATCDFRVAEKSKALTVPNAAVKDEQKGSYVTVIKDPKQPLYLEVNQDKRPVKVGIRGTEDTEILSGLNEGDTVVTQIIQPATAGSTGGTSAGSGSGRRGGPPMGGGVVRN